MTSLGDWVTLVGMGYGPGDGLFIAPDDLLAAGVSEAPYIYLHPLGFSVVYTMRRHVFYTENASCAVWAVDLDSAKDAYTRVIHAWCLSHTQRIGVA